MEEKHLRPIKMSATYVLFWKCWRIQPVYYVARHVSVMGDWRNFDCWAGWNAWNNRVLRVKYYISFPIRARHSMNGDRSQWVQSVIQLPDFTLYTVQCMHECNHFTRLEFMRYSITPYAYPIRVFNQWGWNRSLEYSHPEFGILKNEGGCILIFYDWSVEVCHPEFNALCLQKLSWNKNNDSWLTRSVNYHLIWIRDSSSIRTNIHSVEGGNEKETFLLHEKLYYECLSSAWITLLLLSFHHITLTTKRDIIAIHYTTYVF